MKYIITLFLAHIYVWCSFAQGTITVKGGTLNSSSNYSNMTSYYNVKDGDVILLNDETKGSPYLHDEFKLGSLINNGEILVDNVALKYNAYNDVFIGKENLNAPDDSAKKLSKTTEFQVKIGNNIFIPVVDPTQGYELQYFQILVLGANKLYKKNSKVYKPKIAATSSLVRDVPASFRDVHEYFLVDSEGRMILLPKSKSKMLKSFPSHQKELKDCVKKNGLNLSKEQDLVRLIRFYNSLS